MKRPFSLAIMASALTLLSGCNITPSYDQRYDPIDHSRAYNLAHAANLWKAKDREVDQEDYTAAMSGVNDALGTTLLVNSNFGLGLDWGASLGVGLLDLLLSPPDQLQRDSAFFFVPTSAAPTREAARELVLEQFREAVHKAAAEFGLQPQQREDDDNHEDGWGRQGVGFVLANEELGCPGYEIEVESVQARCRAILQVTTKDGGTAMAPLATELQEEVHFYQASDHKRFTRFYALLPDGASLTQEALTARISAHMPRWFYVYLAPDKDRSRPAMVFEQGKAHLFIVPKG